MYVNVMIFMSSDYYIEYVCDHKTLSNSICGGRNIHSALQDGSLQHSIMIMDSLDKT